MTGHQFESCFIRSLETLGCKTKRSTALDHDQKTDCLIIKIDGYVLPSPYRVQVTLRIGDVQKNREFMAGCNVFREAAFYVEVDDERSAEQAAFALKRAVQGLLAKKRVVCGTFVLTVRSAGTSFSEVRPLFGQSAVPAPGVPVRRRGCISRRLGGAFHVSCDDGKAYLAFATDIADGSLRKTLERAHPNRRLPQLVRVEFDIDDAGGVRRARQVRPSTK